MRVGLFHNRYVEPGGEDRAVELELEMLRKAGHEVELLCAENREEAAGPPMRRLRTALRARWNARTRSRVEAFLDAHPIDVAHVHNFFPVLTPALHHALREHGVPVVQTLHNYRLLCANGALLRDGAPCESCVGRGPWRSVLHGCYRGSRLASAVWADATALHRRLGTWSDCVDRFTTPSAFARRMLLRGGIPPERLEVLPNPVPDPGPPRTPGRGAVYVGRLSPEKGVRVLLAAWRALDPLPLTIVGGGPEEPALREAASGMSGVRFLGAVSPERALSAIAEAAFVVVPSLWYEVFPMSLAEAMACGRAVVASHPTALSEIVEPGKTGLLFERGDPRSLADACAALARDDVECARMGRAARGLYERTLAPDAVSAQLESLLAGVVRRPTCRATA